MSVGLINRIMNKLADTTPQVYIDSNIGNTLYNSTSNSPWTCPANGIVVITPTLNTYGGQGYWYINDKADTSVSIGTAVGLANGMTYTATFPVIKGHQYYTSGSDAVYYANARYYKFKTLGGGSCLIDAITSLVWRWQHERWNTRQDNEFPCRQLQFGAQERKRYSNNGCRWIYHHKCSKRNNNSATSYCRRRAHGITRQHYSKRCGRVVYSCSRKGLSFTLQKHVGDLVYELFRSITPERGCAA